MDLPARPSSSRTTEERHHIPVERLRELLNYNPATGALTWKPRSQEHFATQGSWKAWNTRNSGKPAGSRNSSGYLQVQISLGGRVSRPLAHVIAWALQTGEWPNHPVDHINHQPDDNRWNNLRAVTPAENARNRRRNRNNKSGVTGVFKHKGKWRAQIVDDLGDLRDLGGYATRDEAIWKRIGAQIALGYHRNHGIDIASGESPRFGRILCVDTFYDDTMGRVVRVETTEEDE